jgi:hypothetical protein
MTQAGAPLTSRAWVLASQPPGGWLKSVLIDFPQVRSEMSLCIFMWKLTYQNVTDFFQHTGTDRSELPTIYAPPFDKHVNPQSAQQSSTGSQQVIHSHCLQVLTWAGRVFSTARPEPEMVTAPRA